VRPPGPIERLGQTSYGVDQRRRYFRAGPSRIGYGIDSSLRQIGLRRLIVHRLNSCAGHRFESGETIDPDDVCSLKQVGEVGARGNQFERCGLTLCSASSAILEQPAMRKPLWTTSIVPYGAHETVYIVVDGLGQRGTFRQQREVERTELETVVAELMSGQFNDPICVAAFNTLEHWSKDISVDVAREIQCRCDIDGSDIPQYLAGFIELHIGPTAQLTLHRA
jgi:hypothetical protein